MCWRKVPADDGVRDRRVGGQGDSRSSRCGGLTWWGSAEWRKPDSLTHDPEQFAVVSRQRTRTIRRVVTAIISLWGLLLAGSLVWVAMH